MEGQEFSSNTVSIPRTERHRRAQGRGAPAIWFGSNEVRTHSANFAGGRTLNGTERSNQGPSRTLNGMERSVQGVWGSNLGSELNFSITIKDIQSFLGFTNFYCHFIYEYSRIIILLTNLTCKNVPWNFTDECHPTFNTLKKAFTTTPVLTHWIPDTQITVKTDASDYALAAILSITTPSGELHPIVFHSQMFTSPECNYNVHDKELLAIIEAFTHWRHYLKGSGTPIDIVTDHWNLQYFPLPKSSHVNRHVGRNSFPPSILLYVSVPENLERNPTLLLDDGMSTLKRGIVTMPLSTHRTTNLCSLLSSWHHPFKLLPLLSLSYEDH